MSKVWLYDGYVCKECNSRIVGTVHVSEDGDYRIYCTNPLCKNHKGKEMGDMDFLPDAMEWARVRDNSENLFVSDIIIMMCPECETEMIIYIRDKEFELYCGNPLCKNHIPQKFQILKSRNSKIIRE